MFVVCLGMSILVQIKFHKLPYHNNLRRALKPIKPICFTVNVLHLLPYILFGIMWQSELAMLSGTDSEDLCDDNMWISI